MSRRYHHSHCQYLRGNLFREFKIATFSTCRLSTLKPLHVLSTIYQGSFQRRLSPRQWKYCLHGPIVVVKTPLHLVGASSHTCRNILDSLEFDHFCYTAPTMLHLVFTVSTFRLWILMYHLVTGEIFDSALQVLMWAQEPWDRQWRFARISKWSGRIGVAVFE